jgi:hypothetical protein
VPTIIEKWGWRAQLEGNCARVLKKSGSTVTIRVVIRARYLLKYLSWLCHYSIWNCILGTNLF